MMIENSLFTDSPTGCGRWQWWWWKNCALRRVECLYSGGGLSEYRNEEKVRQPCQSCVMRCSLCSSKPTEAWPFVGQTVMKIPSNCGIVSLWIARRVASHSSLKSLFIECWIYAAFFTPCTLCETFGLDLHPFDGVSWWFLSPYLR